MNTSVLYLNTVLWASLIMEYFNKGAGFGIATAISLISLFEYANRKFVKGRKR